ncbi:MAG: hypothetical protein ACPHER_00065 [Nevskiales bacterium]
MRLLKAILLVLVCACLAILAAGIYRFNFTDDDIYIQQPDGSVIPAKQFEQ